MRKPTAALDAEYLNEIDKARRELRALISAKNCAPHMLRLAWHAAGTYDADTRTGDPYGSIKDEVESNRVAYNRLTKAVDFCEEVKKKCPKITYADLYQLAGVVAVEITGGPTIDFVPGRMDSQGTPDANQGAQSSREVFHRMGLSDKDIVALCGGYTLREAHDEPSGSEGQCASKPLKFDNSYFVELLSSGKATSQSVSIGKARVSLPTDQALLKDPEFCKFVAIYANDEDAFFKAYAASHKKLSELGFKRNLFGDNRVVQGIIGALIASTVAILGYLIQVNRRSKRGDYY